EALKDSSGLSYNQLCEATGVAHSSLMRWKGRMNRSEAVVKKTGPQKLDSPNLNCLIDDVRGLAHRQKRTHGTSELYERYRDWISRRDLREMVRLVREDLKREERAMMRRVHWKVAGFVWSMDDTEHARSEEGDKAYIHLVQDLGSRKKFDPQTGEMLKGVDVAGNLEKQFKEHGPPLFMKRDNAKNLNSVPVNAVLAEFWVIPLNSPKHYPPYNGSIERGINELKELLEQEYGCAGYCPDKLQAAAPLAVHRLNHKSRECLGGKISCQVFALGREPLQAYTCRRRKEVYDQVQRMAADIVEQLPGNGPTAIQAACRIAVETWLRRNGLITVSVNGKVLPHS
ncbi:hypothetical protein ACFLQU_04500, partial [Verrucomicrobiota bacterium]